MLGVLLTLLIRPRASFDSVWRGEFVTTSTTVQEQPRRTASDPVGFVLRRAHWLAGLALVLLGNLAESSIGGSWSSDQRRNLTRKRRAFT
jgi:hypothetical protein